MITTKNLHERNILNQINKNALCYEIDIILNLFFFNVYIWFITSTIYIYRVGDLYYHGLLEYTDGKLPKHGPKWVSHLFSFWTYSICFKHFLIELGCWNFGCRFVPPFSMRLFSNFWNWTPYPLWGGLKPPQKSPIFKHFLIQLECWNFCYGLRPSFCISKR